MEKKLAILTRDVVFGHTLAEYILNSHVLKFRVVAFFDEADYLLFKDCNHVDVLLLGEELSGDLCVGSEERVFILTEENKPDKESVFKYQSLEITVKELAFKLYAAGEEMMPENHKFSIVSVMSGSGGSGVSTFACMLAGVMGRKQEVLLVSLDPFISIPPDMEKGDGDLGELIYSLRTGVENNFSKLTDCIRHSRDFDYVSGVLSFEDLGYFGREEMRNFLAWLSGDGRYKTVIFDMGILPPCSGVILEKSALIYMIGEKKPEAGSQLERILGGNAGEKTREIRLPLVQQFQNMDLAYSDYENTEMWSFVENLVYEQSAEFFSGSRYEQSTFAGQEAALHEPVKLSGQEAENEEVNNSGRPVVAKKGLFGRLAVKQD